jgi:hypothetical protein
MQDRNALPLIVSALKEKAVEVILPKGGNPVKGYLIKISGDGIDPVGDFHAMYQSINGTAFERTEQCLHREDPNALRNHGVLIDSETLRMVFTFNMAFADLYRVGRRLVRLPLTEIFPVTIPEYYGRPCRDGDPCFGERARKLVEKYGYAPRGRVANCLPSFQDALAPHAVSVRLPDKDTLQLLFLIKVWAKTDSKEDYRLAYPSDSPQRLIPIPRVNADFREYGLFIDPRSLELVFAFNTAFAEYNLETKTVDYATVAENVLKRLSVTPRPRRYPRHPGGMHGGMQGVIMYALLEPRE